jgi:quercetin dioxygenase-like cupin family protein
MTTMTDAQARATGLETFSLTPSETVTIRSHTPDALVVEATYAPAGKPPPKHYHPAQNERFRAIEGAVRVRVDGEEHELTAGDEIEIPRNAVHQMWNERDVPARVIWETRPAGRTLGWFRALDRALGERPAGKDMPALPAIAALLNEHRDVIRLAGPDFVLRPALGLLARIGASRARLGG